MNYWLGRKIRLRAIEADDAQTFYNWNLDSERARLLDFVWPPSSLASVQAWIETQSRKNHLEEDRYPWVIEDLFGNPVGTISTHHCDPRSGTFSYGIDIAGEHRRKGYAREAIMLVLKYYFEELRYQKVTVNIHSENLASIRLHEGLGFQLEGKLRRMVYTRGQYLDALWYGLTAEEYARMINQEEEKRELRSPPEPSAS
jgi:RimJ/RimL family protein N-acetyltransferase